MHNILSLLWDHAVLLVLLMGQNLVIKIDNFICKCFCNTSIGSASHIVHGCPQGMGEDQGCSRVAIDANVRLQEVGF